MKKINWKKELFPYIFILLFLVTIEEVLLIRKVPFSMTAMLIVTLSIIWKLSFVFMLRLLYLRYLGSSKTEA